MGGVEEFGEAVGEAILFLFGKGWLWGRGGSSGDGCEISPGEKKKLQAEIDKLKEDVDTANSDLSATKEGRKRDKATHKTQMEKMKEEWEEKFAQIVKEGGEDAAKRLKELEDEFKARLAKVEEEEQQAYRASLFKQLVQGLWKNKQDKSALLLFVAIRPAAIPFQAALYYADRPGQGVICEVNQQGIVAIARHVLVKDPRVADHIPPKFVPAFMQEITCAEFPADLPARLNQFMEAYRSLPPCDHVAQLVGYAPLGTITNRPNTLGIVWEFKGRTNLEELAFCCPDTYSVRHALSIFMQVVIGLKHLHDNDLCQGGLSPWNVRVGLDLSSEDEVGVFASLVESGLMPYKQILSKESISKGQSSQNKPKKTTKNLTESEVAKHFQQAWINGKLDEKQDGEGNIVKFNLDSISPQAYGDPCPSLKPFLNMSATKPMGKMTMEELQKADLYKLGLLAYGLFGRKNVCRSGQEKEFKQRMQQGGTLELPAMLPEQLAGSVLGLLQTENGNRTSLSEVLEDTRMALALLGDEDDGGVIPPVPELGG